LFFWDKSFTNFLNCDPPISISHAAGITGMW
jgi:hypothetical protein